MKPKYPSAWPPSRAYAYNDTLEKKRNCRIEFAGRRGLAVHDKLCTLETKNKRIPFKLYLCRWPIVVGATTLVPDFGLGWAWWFRFWTSFARR